MAVLGSLSPLGYPAVVKIAYHVMSAPAPLGLIFLAATDRGLRYAEFMDRRSIKRIIAGHEAENPGATWEASLLRLKPVVDQFESYFCGNLTSFDVPLDPVGSEFQLEAWKALSAIPFGETRTYGDIARAIGQPKAARAVGLANHDNPIVIIVPCHRVVGADGSLTGYGGGLPRKRWLLRHEARFAAPLFTPERSAPAKTTAPAKTAAPTKTSTPARSTGAAAATARHAVALVAAPATAQRPRVRAAAAPARRVRTAAAPRSGAKKAPAARAGARSGGRRHAR
jgi:methylated-DNA-[protein]-cysteine S-methyltransferase